MSMDKFEIVAQIGEGSFAVVVKAKYRESGNLVAIKKLKKISSAAAMRNSATREIRVLNLLNHENIIHLKEVIKRNNKFYMVFEYMEMNILHLLRSQYPTGFPPTLVRRVLWQVLSGLDHCHDHGVVHRDIKPENILVDSHTMHVKLCDFGFSKVVSSNDSAEMTSYVATRWYRAPELLVASTSYGPGVDIFAAGCVMAELADGDPLLPGASDLDQLRLIDHTLGSIPIYLIDMAQTNGKLLGAIGPVKRGVTLVDRFGMKLSVRALDLLQAMLSVDAKPCNGEGPDPIAAIDGMLPTIGKTKPRKSTKLVEKTRIVTWSHS